MVRISLPNYQKTSRPFTHRHPGRIDREVIEDSPNPEFSHDRLALAVQLTHLRLPIPTDDRILTNVVRPPPLHPPDQIILSVECGLTLELPQSTLPDLNFVPGNIAFSRHDATVEHRQPKVRIEDEIRARLAAPRDQPVRAVAREGRWPGLLRRGF